MNKAEFVTFVISESIDISIFKQIATVIYIELGLQPTDSQHEGGFISALMDVKDPNAYLMSQLQAKNGQREETFYMVNITFWYQWLAYVRIQGTKGNDQRN